MNGSWVTYGLDPENFKLAWHRIQDIFAAEGVPESAVQWVFAPNGWSQPGHDFENYYPGDDSVDVVGFSAFNFGACVAGSPSWDTFEEAISPYLTRMRVMAPDKPIFLAQTGTVEQGGDKDAWLIESFAGLANAPGLRAIIYFNVAKDEPSAPRCHPVDWRVYDPQIGSGYQGFLEGVLHLQGVMDPMNIEAQIYFPLVQK
jgi:beta-mannanase